MICKNCGKQNEEGARYCMSCGNDLQSQNPVIFCTECYEAIDENGKYCAKCGAPINPVFTEDKMLAKQADIRNDSIYQNAIISGEPGSVSTYKYETAIKLLESISGYKDADALINQYTEIVKEQKEKARQEQLVKQKKAKKIKIMWIVLGIIIALILGAVYIANNQDAKEPAEAEPITVVVYEKNDYPEDNMNGLYVPFCELNLHVTNNTDKPIQGFKGNLYVLDNMNAPIYTITWDITGQNIQPGATVDITGYGLEIYENSAGPQEIFNAAFEDLQFRFHVDKIINVGETTPAD